MKQYSWANGYQAKIEAEVAAKELERLAGENNGDVPAENLLEASTPKNAPCHNQFEWNNSIAAHEFRLDQARCLIRSVRVVVVSEEGEPEGEPERIYIRATTEENGSCYITKSKLLSDEDLMHQALTEARNLVLGAQRKFAWLNDLAGIFNETVKKIDRVIKKKKQSAGRG